MEATGPFYMRLQTRNDQVEDAVRVLEATLARFLHEGPPPEALDRAVKNLTGSFPLRVATNRSVLSYLAMIGFYDLPLDFLATFTERVAAQSADAIEAAFARRLGPGAMVTVIVGGQPTRQASAPVGE
jgi:zinc protease